MIAYRPKRSPFSAKRPRPVHRALLVGGAEERDRLLEAVRRLEARDRVKRRSKEALHVRGAEPVRACRPARSARTGHRSSARRCTERCRCVPESTRPSSPSPERGDQVRLARIARAVPRSRTASPSPAAHSATRSMTPRFDWSKRSSGELTDGVATNWRTISRTGRQHPSQHSAEPGSVKIRIAGRPGGTRLNA